MIPSSVVELVFCDANCRLSVSCDGVIGDQLDPTIDSDDYDCISFTDVAFDRQWMAYNVFKHLCASLEDDRGTWYDCNDKLVRCDYMAGNGKVQASPGSFAVIFDFGMCADVNDNLPISAPLTFSCGARSGINKRRACRYDRNAFAKMAQPNEPADVVANATINRQLLAGPIVPFAFDASSHRTVVNTKFEDILVQHFPKPRRVKMQPYLYDGSMQILDGENNLSIVMSDTCGQLRKSLLWFATERGKWLRVVPVTSLHCAALVHHQRPCAIL